MEMLKYVLDMNRSSHIAVRVPAGRLEEAVRHYKTVLGAEEKSRSETGVELAGPNYFLYVETGGEPAALQEFLTSEGPEAKRRFEEAGCRIFEEWEGGFHVADPFGLNYHVYLNKENGDAPPAAGL